MHQTSLEYVRLRSDGFSYVEEVERRAFRRLRRLLRLRSIRRVRPRIRVRGLRRFRFLRKRSGFLSRVRVTCRKALKRFKNGKVHLNDLFAGNFLVMQANSDPFGFQKRKFMYHDLHHLHHDANYKSHYGHASWSSSKLCERHS